MKKIFIIFICAFITLSPLFNCNSFSFAENDEPIENIWVDAETYDDVVAGWKAYLLSRNVYNKGNPVSAMVDWNYSQLNNACEKIGIDMNTLQAGMAYSITGNDPTSKYLKFKYTYSCWNVLNRIYSMFASEHNLGIDENSQFDQDVFSGEIFTDKDGNTSIVFYPVNNKVSQSSSTLSSVCSKLGTAYYYKKNGKQLFEYTQDPTTLHLTNNLNVSLSLNKSSNYLQLYLNNSGYGYLYYKNGNYSESVGILTINKKPDGTYWLGTYSMTYKLDDNSITNYEIYNAISISSPDAVNAAVNLASDGLKAAITANAKAKVIDIGKEGLDSIQDFLADEDIPQDDVNTRDEDEPGPTYNNNIFNIGGIVNANGEVNFEMPDLNNINPKPINNLPSHFLLHGLTQKFPFCIPFDLIAIYEFLDTTPEAPRIQQTIDFGLFNYDLDINLNTYDSAMVNIRKFFVILYIFGLLFVTPQLLK